MLNHSIGSAFGFILLSFLTWTVTFAILVFGVMLRRKILLWDDQWKETIEANGLTMEEYADDLERTYQKVRSTFRLLGFFLVVIVALMGLVVYLGMQEKPVLGTVQVTNSLWLLSLVALSVIVPAFVNFAVGTYLAETMMLKAGAFAFQAAREEFREKKVKIQMMEKAKQLKTQREAMRSTTAAAPEAPNPAPAGK